MILQYSYNWVRNIVKKIVFLKSMPTIQCICGVEIPIIPEYREMLFKIEKHANDHKIGEKDPAKAEAIFNKIQSLLKEQFLEWEGKSKT
jgi:hypothetical protein